LPTIKRGEHAEDMTSESEGVTYEVAPEVDGPRATSRSDLSGANLVGADLRSSRRTRTVGYVEGVISLVQSYVTIAQPGPADKGYSFPSAAEGIESGAEASRQKAIKPADTSRMTSLASDHVG
jgi:hypothetical protein